jgi:hypothetical protein
MAWVSLANLVVEYGARFPSEKPILCSNNAKPEVLGLDLQWRARGNMQVYPRWLVVTRGRLPPYAHPLPSNPPRAVKTSTLPKFKLEYTTPSVPRRDTL